MIANLAIGLFEIHSKGIQHRDLKPANILISEMQGTQILKLTDFGLSKQGVNESNSKTYSFCGTPEYVAPEIVTGAGHD